MSWSRLHGRPPRLRHGPADGQAARSPPLLTQPFAGGMAAWVVIFCAALAGGQLSAFFLNQFVLYYHLT